MLTCSWKQPADWVANSWHFIPPIPLQQEPTTAWPIPRYTLPDELSEHCQQIADEVTENQNEPCNFLLKDFQLPGTLQEVLPPDLSLPFNQLL